MLICDLIRHFSGSSDLYSYCRKPFDNAISDIVEFDVPSGQYDTFVPIVFAGDGLPAQRVSRSVEPVDIAATLSAYLGIKPPSGSVGNPLVDVIPK